MAPFAFLSNLFSFEGFLIYLALCLLVITWETPDLLPGFGSATREWRKASKTFLKPMALILVLAVVLVLAAQSLQW